MTEKGRKVGKLFLVFLLAAGIGCAGYAGWYGYQQYASQKEYEELQRQMEEEQQQKAEKLREIENAEFVGQVDGPEPELPENVKRLTAQDEMTLKETVENPINFEQLKEINPEIYAWIRVPDTKIDYPVAQHEGEDQSFYLKHDMYGNPEFAGCIYTENLNKKDFSDKNTVLYGHNMKNGSMFQNLHRFSDGDYFDKNREVWIYLPDKALKYEIFAAYETDNRHILKSYDFTDPEIFEGYIQTILSSRAMNVHIRNAVEIDRSDKIVTLSTCIGGKPDYRFLVQAVLKEEYPTK